MARKIAPIRHTDELTLVDHLDELRTRIIYSLAFLTLVFALCFAESNKVLHVITKPIDHALSTGGSKKNPTPEQRTKNFQTALVVALQGQQTTTQSQLAVLTAVAAQPGVKETPAIQAQIEKLTLQSRAQALSLARLKLQVPPVDIRPVTLGITEPFLVTIMSALYAALLISMPFLLYQLYAFILPAFTPRERKVALPLMFMVPILFILGVAFGYFMLLPRATTFLLHFNESQFTILVQGNQAVKFTVTFLAGMGLVFQLPVAILAVNRSGIVSVKQLRAWRGYAVVLMLILTAVLTPTPDPFTFVIAAIPLILLYELSILVAAWLDRVRPLDEPDDDDDALDVDAVDLITGEHQPPEASPTSTSH
jgi:sec-independent protein translocase protein TatC